MCSYRNFLYAIISFFLCTVLIYSIMTNKPEEDLQVFELEQVITNKQDLMVLQSLGVKDLQCFKEKNSDSIICAKKGTRQIR